MSGSKRPFAWGWTFQQQEWPGRWRPARRTSATKAETRLPLMLLRAQPTAYRNVVGPFPLYREDGTDADATAS